MKKSFTLLLFVCITSLYAQKSFVVNGYVKLLGSFNHVNYSYIPDTAQASIPETAQDYQIHNRINIKWYGKKNFMAVAGVRNQLYWGYQVNNNPNYGDLLKDQGFLNLSTYWNSDNVYLRIFVDRLYLQWQTQNWKIRLGRQRINWGINTNFNPNDLFNQYNYFDFDYEERPGVDAILIERYLNAYSSVQVAVTPGADTITHSVGAILYKLNKYKTDWQILAGYYRHDIALGGGWASNFLWGSGLKGEFTQFIPIDKNYTEANFTLSTSLDYSFKNSIYLTLGWIYNDNGTLSPSILDQIQIVTSELTAKNLFPYKHTFMASVQYPFTALLSGSLAWIQTPDFTNAYAMPQVTYSLGKDLELMLFSQIFLANNTLDNNNWGYFSSLLFVRFKYSF